MARVLIAEREAAFADSLKKIITRIGHEVIDAQNNSEEILRIAVATELRILLLDTALKGTLDSIEVAQKLRKLGLKIPVIFITDIDNNDLFNRVKLACAFAYVVKPFIEEQLQRTIELALQFYEQLMESIDIFPPRNAQLLLSPDNFFIKLADKLEKIHIPDIAYILVEDRHLVIHTPTRKYVARISLKEMLHKLPLEDFTQIHRNHVININHIQHIDTKNNMVVVLEQSFAISKKHKDYLMEHLNILC